MSETDNSPIERMRRVVGGVLVVVVWAYESYQILFTDSAIIAFEPPAVSFVLFSVFWFGLAGGGFLLREATLTKNKDGNVTGESEIKL